MGKPSAHTDQAVTEKAEVEEEDGEKEQRGQYRNMITISSFSNTADLVTEGNACNHYYAT